jgi:tagaturonate reductase
MFICCELIEDNATTLHKYVLRHAERTNLGADFINWVETACTFCDSLVDRIVPGFPRDNINEIKEELGFDDNLVVKGEFYHLWVIGGKGYEKLQAELPLDKAGLHVVFQPSIKAFRDKKVRILNGSHTGMVPVALQLGCETVADAFHTPIVNKFINEMVEKEVLPVIEGDQAELKAFSAEILERFLNPYIKHYLKSIALNSLSKWEARNFPTVKDNNAKKGQLAKYECFTFAALLALYSPDSTFEPDDTKEHVEYIRSNWNAADLHTTVQKIVKESGIFLLDFSQVPGFVDTVAEYLADIKANGMEAALTNFLARQ